MTRKIQSIFANNIKTAEERDYWLQILSSRQVKAYNDICYCKTGQLGVNITICEHCGKTVVHNSSCKNRSCPHCQHLKQEEWAEKRLSEVVDADYYHITFTLPHVLNPLIRYNEPVMYSLLMKTAGHTITNLFKDIYGADGGVIAVLHTWSQELNFHPHVHCIVPALGLTKSMQIVKGKHKGFLFPVRVLRDVFTGKFLAGLKELYLDDKLFIPSDENDLSDPKNWKKFIDNLYKTKCNPHIKKTFGKKGNAVKYLSKYVYRTAISDSRIVNVNKDGVTFSVLNEERTAAQYEIQLPAKEFIRRFLLHVLPKGFQKVRYYGFLSNRYKNRNLDIIAKLQNRLRSPYRFDGMTKPEIILEVWNVDITLCPHCHHQELHEVRHCGPPIIVGVST